jgi:hypothetical protein
MFLTIWGIKLPPKQNIFSLLQGCQQMLQGSGVKCFEKKSLDEVMIFQSFRTNVWVLKVHFGTFMNFYHFNIVPKKNYKTYPIRKKVGLLPSLSHVDLGKFKRSM